MFDEMHEKMKDEDPQKIEKLIGRSYKGNEKAKDGQKA